MKRINRILLAVLVAQAGIGAALLFGRQQATIARSEKVFANLDPEKVTRLEVSGPRGVDGAPASQATLQLAKDGAVWRLPGFDGYPADAAKVKELLEKLAKLEARGVVVTEKKHHGRLQVKEDAYQRLVKVTADGRELAFFLGGSAGTNGVHLRKQGEDAVLPVSGLRAWDVGDSLSSWLSRDYLKVEPSELWAVEVENQKGAFELARGSSGDWELAGEATTALDKPGVDDLVRRAGSLQLEEPAGRAVKPEYGLDKPLATVTLATGKPKDGGGKPDQPSAVTLRIGAKIEATNRYFVKASTSEYVVQVASWAVEPFLSRTRADLLKKDEKTPTPTPVAAHGSRK